MSGSVARKDADLQRRVALTVGTLRVSKQWTQTELAKRVGISQPTLSLLEKGKRMDISTLNRVAGELGISLSGLIKEAESVGDKESVLRDAEALVRRSR